MPKLSLLRNMHTYACKALACGATASEIQRIITHALTTPDDNTLWQELGEPATIDTTNMSPESLWEMRLKELPGPYTLRTAIVNRLMEGQMEYVWELRHVRECALLTFTGFGPGMLKDLQVVTHMLGITIGSDTHPDTIRAVYQKRGYNTQALNDDISVLKLAEKDEQLLRKHKFHRVHDIILAKRELYTYFPNELSNSGFINTLCRLHVTPPNRTYPGVPFPLRDLPPL